MKKKVHHFNIFRYQLLPIDRYYQGDLFGNFTSMAEILEHKNTLLQGLFLQEQRLLDGKISIIAKKLYEKETFILYKYAVNRSIILETEKFTEEELQNWPSFFVAIWNDPEKQYLVIEERLDAFQHTETVVSTIEKALNGKLRNYQLRIHIEAVFSVEDFWSIIEKHKGEVSKIDFELITPNMANISSALSDDLVAFAKCTNTSVTNFIIAADQDSSLNINKDNPQIVSLVKYSSEGGGNIRLKARGVKKHLQTSQATKSIEIDEVQVSASSSQEIAEIIRGLLG